jgi:translation initiation factor 2 subunit 2
VERLGDTIPDCEVRGNKTFLKNFGRLRKAFRRDPEHFLKYLSRKLATQSRIQGDTVEFQGVFSKDAIKTAIERYLKEFVCCKKCFEASGKLCPDTRLVKQGKTVFLECEACGSKYQVKELK